jgi:hypothetical protein
VIANVDHVANNLARTAAMAAALPPSWAASGDRVRVCGPEGQAIGWALPGEGLALDLDIKSLGITKPIPRVFERTPVRRFADHSRRLLQRLAGDERGVITTYDGIIAARAGGKADDIVALKSSFTTVASTWSSTFRAAGMPGVGTYTAIPTGAAMTAANVGALSLGFTAPTGGDKKYLLGAGFSSSSQLNFAWLVDILWAGGTVSAVLNTAQTVSSAALTRYTTGAGVLATAEVTTALGATPSTFTLNYTNQAGTSGQVSAAATLAASTIAQRLMPSGQLPIIFPASGDTGIRAIASTTLSAAMGSGVLALQLFKPLVFVPGVAANVFVSPDIATQIDGLVELTTDGGGVLGCLAAFVFANITTSGDVNMQLRTAAG